MYGERMEDLVQTLFTALAGGGVVGGPSLWYFRRQTRPNGGTSLWDRVQEDMDRRDAVAKEDRRRIYERLNEVDKHIARLEGAWDVRGCK